ncbi:hypothetical protein IWW48_003450 [Coemansia sp. RSA 1200]|nr:hypothetical protein IWW48_003450 [Coemansia sp. RSA 1200]
MPQRQSRNKRRAESESANTPALATLANLAACKRYHHDTSLSAYSLTGKSNSCSNSYSNTSSYNGSGTAALSPTMHLTFNPETRLPAPDIVAELLSHVDQEFNIISKIVQPKKLLEGHQSGRLCSFLLLAVLANNALFSSHPAIVAIGTVPAVRAFVDRAKVFVPDALETPSVTCCQALLLLSVAYMHLGMLDVSSHYSSMSLRILQKLGVYKIDDSAWTDGEEWISESWLEREQIRRLIWGSFTIDTFLALMLHSPPYVLVDLSGVNRPCSQNTWYIGNENLEALSFSESSFGVKPGDSEYLTTLKKLKLAGMPWQANGTTLQINFSVLGNAILRGISDPQFSQEVLDRLVLRAFQSLAEWIALVPPLPDSPSCNEVHHTLLISSVALCLKSVMTPYLITRTGDALLPGSAGNESPLVEAARATACYSEKAYGLPSPPADARLDQELALDWMLKDYISSSCHLYRYMRLTHDMMKSCIVPPMFSAHTAMISGGIFAACAHSAPTAAQRARFAILRDYVVSTCRLYAAKSLLFGISVTEIQRVEEMVRFMPRRLDPAQFKAIRKALMPGSLESLVNKRFSSFIHTLRDLARMPPVCDSASGSPQMMCSSSVAADSMSAPVAASSSSCSSIQRGGIIPLTRNLRAIFGRFVKCPVSSMASMASSLSSGSAWQDDEKKRPMAGDSASASAANGATDGNDRCFEDYAASSDAALGAVPDYKLTFMAVSSLMVGLSMTTKDEAFLAFVPELRTEAASESTSASSLGGSTKADAFSFTGVERSTATATATATSFSSATRSVSASSDQTHRRMDMDTHAPIYSSSNSNSSSNNCYSAASAFAWSLANRVCSARAQSNSKEDQRQELQQRLQQQLRNEQLQRQQHYQQQQQHRQHPHQHPLQQQEGFLPPPLSPQSVRSAPTPPPHAPPSTMMSMISLSPPSSSPADIQQRPASEKPCKASNLVDLLN